MSEPPRFLSDLFYQKIVLFCMLFILNPSLKLIFLIIPLTMHLDCVDLNSINILLYISNEELFYK